MKKTSQFICKLKPSMIILSAAIGLSACNGNEEVDIPVSEVPSSIINVVQSALPGIKLSGAEKETKDNGVIYELEGKLINGKKYELKIAADGTIIKIKLDD
jgi:hypothetical protein